MPPLRIFIADHDEVIRNVMTAVLVRDGWEICGEASSGQEAIAKITTLKPDLVLMDGALTNPSGFDATRQIVQKDSAQPIVMLGTTDDEATARKAFEAGALGYVLKANTTRDLATAVRSLMNGKTFFTPRIAENILHSYFQIGPNQQTAPIIRSERDRVAVKLLAREAATADGHSQAAPECWNAALSESSNFCSGRRNRVRDHLDELPKHHRRQRAFPAQVPGTKWTAIGPTDGISRQP